jgi:phage gp46-like protein
MSDIALSWNEELGGADFALNANDLATDDGLETAVILSLFTDRRAEDSDVLPDGQTDRRGWWGDEFSGADGDRIGSRLWLLSREKSVDTVAGRAKEYAREALDWLVDDQIASAVNVQSELVDKRELALSISIQRPGGSAVEFRYQYNWAAQEAKAA